MHDAPLLPSVRGNAHLMLIVRMHFNTCLSINEENTRANTVILLQRKSSFALGQTTNKMVRFFNVKLMKFALTVGRPQQCPEGCMTNKDPHPPSPFLSSPVVDEGTQR
ncbi:hypothetical protein PoB_002342400 [Plakobranchus ocellatus]|uniref:Uncharacterized protein n=1 Tax=Plakobranchus ocellatus TaxID=259542 RepID=A0AAV3ZR78_9GAST|nr:hypothetical protein PoB_002342400 [Plakobranchus ocellatus]